MLLELTFRNSKRSKDLVQHQSTTLLIMHILEHIKDQRKKFGSTQYNFCVLVPIGPVASYT